MPRFIVREKTAIEVEFIFVVEADTAEEAQEDFYDLEHEEIGVVLGDELPYASDGLSEAVLQDPAYPVPGLYVLAPESM